MYHYVKDNAFLKLAYSTVSKYMKKLIQLLREEETTARAFHIGVGGTRNMVTQNDDGPIDFDFSISIIDSRFGLRECRYIKTLVRTKLAEALNIKDVDEIIDSLYGLSTGIMHLDEYPNIDFKINICIICYQYRWENYYQLVHVEFPERNYNKYYWTEVFDSEDLSRQVRIIKEEKLWKELKEYYLSYKNSLLDFRPMNSFFGCYNFAVNKVRDDYELYSIDYILRNENIFKC